MADCQKHRHDRSSRTTIRAEKEVFIRFADDTGNEIWTMVNTGLVVAFVSYHADSYIFG
jgi:hypothetical protein